MASLVDARLARERIIAEQRDPEPGPWFADKVMSAFGCAVGFDGYCLFGVDPISGTRSVMFSRHGLGTSTERLIYNETIEPDVNRYRDLAARPSKAGVLAAGQHQPASPRLDDILRPDGYHSELRLALVADGSYWGALSLFRTDRRRPFTDADADVADDLGAVLTGVIRRYQAGIVRSSEVPSLSGVVAFDRAGHVVSVTDEAQHWLDLLADSWDDGAVAADVIRVVHEVASAAAGRTAGTPLCRVRMPTGGWLVVSGTRIDTADIDVIVHLRPGDVRTVLPAFAALCGLTAREREVAAALVDGGSAQQLARRLSISVLTLNDHLRSIYRKARVRGRDELLALLC